MPGLKISLPTAFTDATLPVLRPDSVINPAAATGVLALYETAHSYLPAGAGVAAGLQIPNVAWESTAALLGSGDQASLSPTLAYDGAYVDGTTGKFERTSKGALHGVPSQVGNTAANQGASIVLPLPVRTFIVNNSGHSYFMSLWDRETRVAASGTVALSLAAIQNNASAAANRLGAVTVTGFNGGGLGTVASQAFNSLGNAYYELGQAGFTGSVPAAAALCAGIFWGTTNASGSGQNGGSSNYNKCPSHIFYRFYLEDLTVSGRSFATVAALDQAAFTAAFATGGRYAGDTFTAPSTLLA